jgi:hypothetical protein
MGKKLEIGSTVRLDFVRIVFFLGKTNFRRTEANLCFNISCARRKQTSTGSARASDKEFLQLQATVRLALWGIWRLACFTSTSTWFRVLSKWMRGIKFKRE